MRVAGRQKAIAVFLALGICSVALAVALNVGWILLNLQQIALLVFGIIFFALVITGLVLNTIFLIREIRRNEQHDAFLNAVTHELKTPIASIHLYLETLKTRSVTEEKKQEFYDVMIADTNRLLNTVEQVLQASQARERKQLLNISEIEPAGLLRDCVDIVRRRYNLNKDTIAFEDLSGGAKILGDTAELQAVFTNLLDNAVKYSGDAVAKISVELKIADKKSLEIRINDEGIGIPPDQLKRIFRRFYRVPGFVAHKAKGTGLGLFIVQTIVKKHKGKIFAKSEGENLGSTFVVRLPKI
ncbi:MAG: HAMP domain-containing histidine kinase [Acidobacteria bacterium]|nr:HAMP domain-containing histidine kinase [Acidobacteriota bacterium]